MDKAKSDSKKGGHKIGVMGGTFDPVHNGHLVIAEKAREEFNLKKVLFIPSGIPAHKQKVFAPSSHRLAMVKIAIENNKYFEASTLEVKRKKPSYTYDTVSLLNIRYQVKKIYFIVGEDALSDIKSWYRYEDLIKKVIFLVAPREHKDSVNIPVIPFLEYRFLNIPRWDISSSYIRNCISSEKTVKYLLPDRVIRYIKNRGLYGTRERR